jgi:glycine oxidase
LPQKGFWIATHGDCFLLQHAFRFLRWHRPGLVARTPQEQILQPRRFHEARVGQPRRKLRLIEKTAIGEPILRARGPIGNRIIQLQSRLLQRQRQISPRFRFRVHPQAVWLARSLLYNAAMKSWDVIVIGGGIIGLSLSVELRKKGASVLVVERAQPGREASYAAGGMLVDSTLETRPALQPLAIASARLYPEFADELEVESGLHVDLRDQGAIVFPSPEHMHLRPGFTAADLASLVRAPLSELEPALAEINQPAFFLKERSIDPRALANAALQSAKRRGVDISSADAVTALNLSEGRVCGVATEKTSFLAPKVVNCAGAWSGRIPPHAFPTRPVKGQMLCLASPARNLLKHVIRSPEVYLIPRSDGRILVGTTVEEAGFDKRTDVATIQHLHRAAIAMLPELSNAKILEDWAGLRPGTSDGLPILGATPTPGYYVATGHFRDGILLAPITAQVVAAVIEGRTPDHDLAPFSPARFSNECRPLAGH